MAVRSIKLSRETNLQQPVLQRGDCVRTVVTASEATLIQAAIFVHQKSVLDPQNEAAEPIDEFVGVASPVDLATYPIGEPAVDQVPPYFLKSEIDFVVASTRLAVEAWAMIQEEVQQLLEAYYRMELLTPDAEVTLSAAAVGP